MGTLYCVGTSHSSAGYSDYFKLQDSTIAGEIVYAFSGGSNAVAEYNHTSWTLWQN